MIIFRFRHREIRRQMSHSQAIQGLTLKPDVLVDDSDINDREVMNSKIKRKIIFVFNFLETCCRKTQFNCQPSRSFTSY
jgi:hypothetical protein